MKSDKPLLKLVQEPKLKAPRTEAQHQASRRSGSKSKGPVRAQGKYHSSQSALRHGLTATKFTILANEDPAQYNEVMNSFIADYQPATKAELRLVERIANLDWRMERFTLIENCLFNMTIGEHFDAIDTTFEHLDGVSWIVAAWRESHDLHTCLGLLVRYMGTLQHQYNSTIANFHKMEKRRRDRKHDPDLDPDYNPPYEKPEFETLNKEPDGEEILHAIEEQPEQPEQPELEEPQERKVQPQPAPPCVIQPQQPNEPDTNPQTLEQTPQPNI